MIVIGAGLARTGTASLCQVNFMFLRSYQTYILEPRPVGYLTYVADIMLVTNDEGN